MSMGTQRQRQLSTVGAAAESPQRRLRPAQLAIIALIPLGIGGVAALGFWLRADRSAAPVSPAAAVSAITEHKPWEYDPIGDRHWNAQPGHQHWHPGPPPAPEDTANSGTLNAGSIRGPFSGTPNGTLAPASMSPGAPVPIAPAPSGPQPGDPAAWQYDATTDQHWHPGHRHWHKGPAPPPDQQQ